MSCCGTTEEDSDDQQMEAPSTHVPQSYKFIANRSYPLPAFALFAQVTWKWAAIHPPYRLKSVEQSMLKEIIKAITENRPFEVILNCANERVLLMSLKEYLKKEFAPVLSSEKTAVAQWNHIAERIIALRLCSSTTARHKELLTVITNILKLMDHTHYQVLSLIVSMLRTVTYVPVTRNFCYPLLISLINFFGKCIIVLPKQYGKPNNEYINITLTIVLFLVEEAKKIFGPQIDDILERRVPASRTHDAIVGPSQICMLQEDELLSEEDSSSDVPEMISGTAIKQSQPFIVDQLITTASSVVNVPEDPLDKQLMFSRTIQSDPVIKNENILKS